MIRPSRISGPLFTDTRFRDAKDPCVVYDGALWHIYGSGGDVRGEIWQILHATAPDISGPWKEIEPAILNGVRGDHVAAPSVYFDTRDKSYHMTVQTEFTSVGGKVEYLRSTDGLVFTRIGTALESLPGTSEAGIYDPHQSVIGGRKFLAYAGTPAVERTGGGYVIQPDAHLAECESPEGSADTSWNGPWKRFGIILDHDRISWHHNAREHKEYEWGIEGPQVVALPNGKFLLNATCFLGEGIFGTRQRVFFAIADEILGPYQSLGPVIDPADCPGEFWQSGENGHASAIAMGETLYLFFQARPPQDFDGGNSCWRYGIAEFPIDSLHP